MDNNTYMLDHRVSIAQQLMFAIMASQVTRSRDEWLSEAEVASIACNHADAFIKEISNRDWRQIKDY